MPSLNCSAWQTYKTGFQGVGGRLACKYLITNTNTDCRNWRALVDLLLAHKILDAENQLFVLLIKNVLGLSEDVWAMSMVMPITTVRYVLISLNNTAAAEPLTLIRSFLGRLQVCRSRGSIFGFRPILGCHFSHQQSIQCNGSSHHATE